MEGRPRAAFFFVRQVKAARRCRVFSATQAGNNLETYIVLLWPLPRTPMRRPGTGLSDFASEAAVRRISRRGASVRSGRVAGSEKRGIGMFAGLVWRTILFFGLTAGYAILAALPYLA
jgi:hypothetical protein